jgi:hypothetical protein
LARELTTRQHPISHEKVAQLLRGERSRFVQGDGLAGTCVVM